MVVLDTGTNFPAVRVNSLLATAMMKTRERWKETGSPTQSHIHAASLTLSAWNSLPLSQLELICVML
jgi:aryl carrier-like protein